MRQGSIFEAMYPEAHIDKPIRLIELFAGIGAQAKALECLGAKFESHRVVEWSAHSIIAYNAIHVGDWEDHSEELGVEEILDRVDGVSLDYNKPADREALRRKGEPWLRRLYSSMVAIKDVVPDVSRVKADDLEIRERERYCYVLTYSFPCQDLSRAGRGAGMEKGSGTRSGLLWEVERILNECKALDCLPQVLIMENVPQVYADKNLKAWSEWVEALKGLGYSNYAKTLNAKDYGIPQNRQRAFMVSILGEYAYTFPRPIPLRHPLRDFLDANPGKDYFLKPEKLQRFKWLEDGHLYAYDTQNDRLREEPQEALTVQTRPQVPKHDERIIRVGDLQNYNFKQADEVLSAEGVSSTVTAYAGGQEGHDVKILVPCDKGKYYLEAKEGDGMWHSWEGARGAVQKGCSPTILTSGGELGVATFKEKENGK